MNMNMKQVEMDFTHSQSLVGGKANLTMSDRKVSEDAAAKGKGGLNREQAQTGPWKCPVPELRHAVHLAMGKLCSASIGKNRLVSCHLNSGRPLRSPACYTLYFFGHFHLGRTGTQPPRTPFLGTVFGGHRIPSFVTESHQWVPFSRFLFLVYFLWSPFLSLATTTKRQEKADSILRDEKRVVFGNLDPL